MKNPKTLINKKKEKIKIKSILDFITNELIVGVKALT